MTVRLQANQGGILSGNDTKVEQGRRTGTQRNKG